MRRAGKIAITILIVLVIVGAGFGIFSYTVLKGDSMYEVQIIPVRGTISVFGQASAQKIVSQIENAESNPLVKAIIIEINSPGGTVVASEEIANAIEATDKPVVAWMREVAASGGYWIASSADKIVADPATLTGSLGVTASYLQFAGLMDEYGITYERVVAGAHKDVGSPYQELSDTGRTMLQSKVNKIRDMFISHISDTRNMSWSAAENLATGELFLGVEAKEKGLVDILGGKDRAFILAKELANIDSAKLSKPGSDVKSILEKLLSAHAYWFGRGISGGQVSKFVEAREEPLVFSM